MLQLGGIHSRWECSTAKVLAVARLGFCILMLVASVPTVLGLADSSPCFSCWLLLQVFCSMAKLCPLLHHDAKTKEHLIQLAEIGTRLMSDLQTKSSILDAAVLEFCAGIGSLIGEETLFYTLCADRSMAHRLFTSIMNERISSQHVKPTRQLYCNVLKFCTLSAETLRSVESQVGAFTKDYIGRRLQLSTTRDPECVARCVESCALLKQLLEISERLPGWKCQWAIFDHQRIVLQVLRHVHYKSLQKPRLIKLCGRPD